MATVNSDILLLSHTVFCLLYSREVYDFGCSPHLQHLKKIKNNLIEVKSEWLFTPRRMFDAKFCAKNILI